MKLSKNTIALLKNFSNINQSIKLGGNTLRTIAPATKDVLGQATIDEILPEVALYDIKVFLSCVDMMNEHDVDFGVNSVIISDKKSKAKAEVFYVEPEVIVSPPEKELTLPDEVGSFTLTDDLMRSLTKASSTFGASDLKIESNGKEFTITIWDKRNPGNGNFSVEVEGDVSESFSYNTSLSNINVIPGDYNVTVHAGALKITSDLVEYVIALNA